MTIKIKAVIDEDFSNYKKPSMLIGFPYCSFKCETECGMQVCQNSVLATAKTLVVDMDILIKRYLDNNLTSSIVCGGLEPMDTYEMICDLIYLLRCKYHCEDDIVIYTGYTEEECRKNGWIANLQQYKNIIIKFGRYIPYQDTHYDEVLGVMLASDNQYAKKIC